VRLALDHHYSHQIAEQLRARGHDVVAVYERGWHRLGDEELLDRCVAEARTLLTNNVSDFVGLSQQWAGQGRYHAGLVFTADASLPRTLATIGRYVELLEALLTDNPGDTDFIGRIHWL
jgi:predicted nuclease of predicted toxin-antitoxin system